MTLPVEAGLPQIQSPCVQEPAMNLGAAVADLGESLRIADRSQPRIAFEWRLAQKSSLDRFRQHAQRPAGVAGTCHVAAM